MFIISWIFHNILSLSPILFHQEVYIDQIIRYLINLDIGLIATDWVHVHKLNLYYVN